VLLRPYPGAAAVVVLLIAACAAAIEDCVLAPEDGLEVVGDVGDVGVGVEFDVE